MAKATPSTKAKKQSVKPRAAARKRTRASSVQMPPRKRHIEPGKGKASRKKKRGPRTAPQRKSYAQAYNKAFDLSYDQGFHAGFAQGLKEGGLMQGATA